MLYIDRKMCHLKEKKMTIVETSKKYDLTPDTLRYYERIGLLNGVTRMQNGMMKILASELNLSNV